MKKVLLTIMIAAACTASYAQDLVPDQNPSYKQSMDKYAAALTSLQTTMNTTVQNTYKAYDWSTAKAERQAERRAFRRERALNNRFSRFNNNFYDDGFYNNGFNNNFYNRNFYNRRNNWSNWFCW